MTLGGAAHLPAICPPSPSSTSSLVACHAQLMSYVSSKLDLQMITLELMTQFASLLDDAYPASLFCPIPQYILVLRPAVYHFS